MVRAIASWIFVCGFAVCAAVGFVIGSVAQITIDNLQCHSRGYGDSNFLAHCQSEKYADYEHGAFYYGVEPGIRNSIRTANVVFLGNSAGQAGFSSKALKRYFNDRNIPFFVMGFGYGEGSSFALAIWKKYRPSPKVLVVNADPFFSDTVSLPGQEAMEGRPVFLFRLMLKALFQRVHRVVCFVPWYACPERDRGIFRSASDGQWTWIDPQVARRAVPVNPSVATQLPQAVIERLEALGEAFIAAVGVSRSCIIFTAAPHSTVNLREIAEEMAVALKVRSVFPTIDGLSTIDGVHLNPASAEIWSSRLIEGMAPILQECLVS